jgi:hypothetical protein
MKSLFRSLKPSKYRSAVDCESSAVPGVAFQMRRMSLGRRIELAEAIRDLAQELEFHQAGESPKEQVEAAVMSARIDRVYLRWGLLKISGLSIDGRPATAEALFADGPEGLLREIVDRIKSECGLTDDHRKN